MRVGHNQNDTQLTTGAAFVNAKRVAKMSIITLERMIWAWGMGGKWTTAVITMEL
jgi:hypothetical protein